MKDNFSTKLDIFCRYSSAIIAVTIFFISIVFLILNRDTSLSNETVNYIENFTDIHGNKVAVWILTSDKNGTDLYSYAYSDSASRLLILQTHDTYVDVYINGRLVYSDDRNNNPVSLESDGFKWLKIPLNTFTPDLNIKITCYPSHSDNKCIISHFYVGDANACLLNILQEHIPATVISTFFSILGLVLICYFIYYFIKYRTGRDFLFVGIAIISTSTWSLLDTGMISFFWDNSEHFLLLSYICQLMIPLSFGLICSYRAVGKYKISLNLFTIVCEINMIIIFILFFLFDIDFYYTKWSTIFLILLSIPLLCRLVFTYQDENKLLSNNIVILTFLIIVTACFIMWIYRIRNGFNHDTSFMIRTSIICFNGCIICYHAKMTVANYRNIYKNSILHDFQIKDRVTGFYNRAALTENSFKYVGQSKKSNVGVAFFKLRHVKQINETYGYENGTALLQNFTSIVRSSFPEDCDFYRIGTRHFYVMIPGDNPNEIYSDALLSIEKNVNETNEYRSQPYKMVYDSSFIYDPNLGVFDIMDIAIERI